MGERAAVPRKPPPPSPQREVSASVGGERGSWRGRGAGPRESWWGGVVTSGFSFGN